MNKTEKIKRAAIIVFIIFSILFFLQTVQLLSPLIPGIGFFTYTFPPPLTVFLSLAQHIGVYILCFLLLRTIIKNETPFKKKTVTLLKIIALLFICIDVEGTVRFIFRSFQLRRNNPVPTQAYTTCFYTGYTEETVIYVTHGVFWFGGFAAIAGLIIYLIALVLKYGISLQTQVDETL